jgi:protein transport protein SEC24
MHLIRWFLQLILPESLKLLPLYILSLLKNIAFRLGGNIPIDDRVYQMQYIKSMNLKTSILLVYPKLMRIDTMAQEVGEYNERCELILPECLRASYERLSEEGAYLLGKYFYETCSMSYYNIYLCSPIMHD